MKRTTTAASTLDPYEQEIVVFGTRLISDLLDKYRKGKAEHGRLPSKLNCRREIAMEVFDILIYHQISKVNERLRRKRRYAAGTGKDYIE